MLFVQVSWMPKGRKTLNPQREEVHVHATRFYYLSAVMEIEEWLHAIMIILNAVPIN
jgi:hypothetical protein